MTRKPVYPGRTNSAILAGDADLREWDDEELLRGQRKSKNGQFHGKPPKVVPMGVHQELTRRRLSKAYELLRDDLVAACQLLGSVVRDDNAPYKDRIKASEIIIERVMGKVPEKIDVAIFPTPLEQAFKAMLVPDDEALSLSAEDIVDAELVDGDDYPLSQRFVEGSL